MEKNAHLIKNALLAHKIAELRDIKTEPKRFRELATDIAMIETYEAMKGFPTITKNVTTPLEVTPQEVIDEKNVCLVPILRAGLGMEEGAHRILPNAHAGFIGMYRDETTFEAKPYFARFPKGIEKMEVILLDPMLATGGSAIDAIEQLHKVGVTHIRFLCIIAAPEGVERVTKKFPEIPVYIGALDRELNSKCYILPGLGDAGDRIFNTLD